MTTLIEPAQQQASEELRKQTAHSVALHERAAKVFPGGDFRRAAYMPPAPVYVERAEGAYLYDVDGNRMIDFNGNFTSMVVGHSHPRVVEAVQATASKFMALASPTENAVELGELIVSRVPSVEKLRFACSGSEAVMFAIRGARAFTGRTKIMKMEGAYHGTYDPIEDEKAGVPEAAYADVVLGRYNDCEYTERALLDHREELAAVIVAVGYGTPPPEPEFLQFIRETTERYGILFILDEVVSLRLAPGGAQEMYGVTPDMTTMGKIIGGGFAVGGFGGRADIMEIFSPDHPGGPHHSGTFVGTPLTMAAGLATMRVLDGQQIERINALGNRLSLGLQSTLDELEIPGSVEQVGSLVNLRLGADASSPARNPQTSDVLTLAMARRGLYARRNVFVVSTPMNEEDVDAGVRGVRESLLEFRDLLV